MFGHRKRQQFSTIDKVVYYWDGESYQVEVLNEAEGDEPRKEVNLVGYDKPVITSKIVKEGHNVWAWMEEEQMFAKCHFGATSDKLVYIILNLKQVVLKDFDFKTNVLKHGDKVWHDGQVIKVKDFHSAGELVCVNKDNELFDKVPVTEVTLIGTYGHQPRQFFAPSEVYYWSYSKAKYIQTQVMSSEKRKVDRIRNSVKSIPVAYIVKPNQFVYYWSEGAGAFITCALQVKDGNVELVGNPHADFASRVLKPKMPVVYRGSPNWQIRSIAADGNVELEDVYSGGTVEDDVSINEIRPVGLFGVQQDAKNEEIGKMVMHMPTFQKAVEIATEEPSPKRQKKADGQHTISPFSDPTPGTGTIQEDWSLPPAARPVGTHPASGRKPSLSHSESRSPVRTPSKSPKFSPFLALKTSPRISPLQHPRSYQSPLQHPRSHLKTASPYSAPVGVRVVNEEQRNRAKRLLLTELTKTHNIDENLAEKVVAQFDEELFLYCTAEDAQIMHHYPKYNQVMRTVLHGLRNGEDSVMIPGHQMAKMLVEGEITAEMLALDYENSLRPDATLEKQAQERLDALKRVLYKPPPLARQDSAEYTWT